LSQQSFSPSLAPLLPLHLLTKSDGLGCDDDIRHAAVEADAAAVDDENDDDEEEDVDGKAALLEANAAVPRECGRVHCGILCEPLLQFCSGISAAWEGSGVSVRETQQPMRKSNGVVG
jgi:hypothetical protein